MEYRGARGLQILLIMILSSLVSACSSLFYYPDRYLHYPPDKLGLKREEISFQSRDGTKLVAWVFRARKTPRKGMLVQFHGNAQNVSSHYISLVWLIDHGYDLFIFDYRGYGGSEGEPSQKGTYLDGLAALDQAWALNQSQGVGKFVVVGQSLGGAIAMRALDDFAHKDKVALLVMDSTFVSYKDVARRVLARGWLTWLFSPLGMVLVSDKYGAEDALRRNRIPLLVIHDKKDGAVPYGAGQEIFEMASEPKAFWTLEKGRHIGAFADDEPALRARFVRTLDQGIQEAR